MMAPFSVSFPQALLGPEAPFSAASSAFLSHEVPLASQSPGAPRARSLAPWAAVTPTRLRPQASRAAAQTPMAQLGQAYACAPSPCYADRGAPCERHTSGALSRQSLSLAPSPASAAAGPRHTLRPCAAAPGRGGPASWSGREEQEEQEEEEEEEGEEGEEYDDGEEPVMSRARARRLEKGRQKRGERQREQELMFQEFSRDVASRHPELMDLLEDPTVGPQSAEELANKVEERLKAKFGDWIEERTGSDQGMAVTIRDLDPFDLTLWLELQSPPSEEQLYSLSSVFRAWYLIGKVGGYNAANLQFQEDSDGSLLGGPLGEASPKPRVYRTEAGTGLPAAMHNISDLEVQGTLVKVWVDMGTADMLALDILLNALLCFSTDHVGIKSLTLGGESMPRWSESAREVQGSNYQVVEI